MAAAQLEEYLVNGNIKNSVNFPDCEYPRGEGWRIAIINRNVTNMVGQITAVLAQNRLKIEHMLNHSRGAWAYTCLLYTSTQRCLLCVQVRTDFLHCGLRKGSAVSQIDAAVPQPHLSGQWFHCFAFYRPEATGMTHQMANQHWFFAMGILKSGNIAADRSIQVNFSLLRQLQDRQAGKGFGDGCQSKDGIPVSYTHLDVYKRQTIRRTWPNAA